MQKRIEGVDVVVINIFAHDNINNGYHVKSGGKPHPSFDQEAVEVVVGEATFISIKIIHAKTADHKKQFNAINADRQKVCYVNFSDVAPGVAMNRPGMYPKHTQGCQES